MEDKHHTMSPDMIDSARREFRQTLEQQGIWSDACERALTDFAIAMKLAGLPEADALEELRQGGVNADAARDAVNQVERAARRVGCDTDEDGLSPEHVLAQEVVRLQKRDERMLNRFADQQERQGDRSTWNILWILLSAVVMGMLYAAWECLSSWFDSW